MLSTSPLHAFIPTLNPTHAKEFYGEIPGLPQVSESPFALEFEIFGFFEQDDLGIWVAPDGSR